MTDTGTDAAQRHVAADPPRPAQDLPGRGRGGRQDVRDAGRGSPPPVQGRRRRRGLRRDARPPAHRRAARRPGGHAEGHDRIPGDDVRGDGRRRRPGQAPSDRLRRRVRPHERPRLAQPQALGGRRGTAERRNRRDHQRQHPAPRVAERRGREDHRGAAAGDGARRRGPRGRPGRAHRHDAGGAAPQDGAWQHLPGREDRRGAQQLLPARQPRGAARARAALARRQGRRGTAAVPRSTRHPRHLGGQGAGRGSPDRRTRRRDADQARCEDRRASGGRRPARAVRDQIGRPHRSGSRRAGRPAAARRVARRQLPPGRRRRRA